MEELMNELELRRSQTKNQYARCTNVYERSYYDGYASAIADIKRWLIEKKKAKEPTIGDSMR